jgi:hypothetical protein
LGAESILENDSPETDNHIFLSLSALLVCPFIGIKTFSCRNIVSKEEFRFIFFQIRYTKNYCAFFTEVDWQ